MLRILLMTALALLARGASAQAGTLRIVPGDVTLTGPHASQRLLVVDEAAGDVVADVTTKATFTSSAAAVAAVDKQGMVQAKADGEAVIRAQVGEQLATVKVKVAKTKEPFAWSFRNHVTPVLTRVGCNSGACHGALAGKGG